MEDLYDEPFLMIQAVARVQQSFVVGVCVGCSRVFVTVQRKLALIYCRACYDGYCLECSYSALQRAYEVAEAGGKWIPVCNTCYAHK